MVKTVGIRYYFYVNSYLICMIVKVLNMKLVARVVWKLSKGRNALYLYIYRPIRNMAAAN